MDSRCRFFVVTNNCANFYTSLVKQIILLNSKLPKHITIINDEQKIKNEQA